MENHTPNDSVVAEVLPETRIVAKTPLPYLSAGTVFPLVWGRFTPFAGWSNRLSLAVIYVLCHIWSHCRVLHIHRAHYSEDSTTLLCMAFYALRCFDAQSLHL